MNRTTGNEETSPPSAIREAPPPAYLIYKSVERRTSADSLGSDGYSPPPQRPNKPAKETEYSIEEQSYSSAAPWSGLFDIYGLSVSQSSPEGGEQWLETPSNNQWIISQQYDGTEDFVDDSGACQILNTIDDENWSKSQPWRRRKSYQAAATQEEKVRIQQKLISKRELRSFQQRQNFILKLSRALMLYGAPSHRLESQLKATARRLQVSCQFVHFPGIVVVSFDSVRDMASETHVVKATTRLMLGKLHSVHSIYRAVMHAEIGVCEGTARLKRLMQSKPAYPTLFRCFVAFCSASIISPLAFGGSILDGCISGCAGGILAYLQLHAVKRSMMYANVFEITTAMWVAFVARGLSSWKGDYFCYSAISTAGVVLILPGFAMLCSALDLASKNLISGSARLVWAISYTLFLGFSMTVGSDLYFVMDSTARERRRSAVASLTNTLVLDGFVTPNQNVTTAYESLVAGLGNQLRGQWTFVNQTQKVSAQYHYQIVGCYRETTWPWYRKPFPTWTLFILVPLYSMTSSLWNLQPVRSWQFPVMVAISCTSYACRKILQHFIGDRKEVVSAAGAFVIGILGNAYARLYKATPFTSMVTGVLFLVPSGIAAAGGLARNYDGTEADQYTSSITIGIRMLQVAIGTTVGLLTSSLVVYAFGSKKRSALFAF